MRAARSFLVSHTISRRLRIHNFTMAGKKTPGKRIRAVQIIRNRIVAHSDEDPSKLVANPLNFRRHPGAQREALRGSVKELGWIKSVLVNRSTGNIIDGHARVEEALAMKQGTVPVDWVELSPEEERLALAVLDPITEMATRDDETLAGLLAQVSTKDEGLMALLEQLSADAQPAKGELLTDEDAVPDPPKKAKTKPGYLYLLGKHRLLCGDSTKNADVQKLMGGDKAACMWTDPPYGVEYVGKTKNSLTIKNDGKEGLRDLLDSAFLSATSALRGGAAIYVAHPAGALNVTFGTAFLAAGWRLHQTLIWDKETIVLGHSDYHFSHEPIFYGFAPSSGGRYGRGGKGWYGGDSERSVLRFPKPPRSAEHPTMNPVALVEYCITNSSKPGQLVLDPFGGSGTTLIACEKAGRRAYLMELDPIYCDVICRRWEEATGKKAILEAHG